MRLRARSAVVCLGLLSASLASPAGVARADSPPYQPSASLALQIGDGQPAPVGQDAVVLPDGSIAQTGRLSASTRFGETVVDPAPDGSPTGYVAVAAPEGSGVRWAHDLGAAGLQPAGLAPAGGDVVTLAAPRAGAGMGLLVRWDGLTGAPRWDRWLGPELCAAPDLAPGPEGVLVVAGSFTGVLELGSVRRVADSSCDGFVAAFDGATGALLWDHQLTGTHDVVLQQVAADEDGSVVVAGALGGSLEVDGRTLGGEGFTGGLLARLRPGGQAAWSRSFPCGGCWTEFRELVLHEDLVLVRTPVDLDPWVADGSTVAALSALDGSVLWQVPLPTGEDESLRQPIVVPRAGTVVVATPFTGDLSWAGHQLSSRGLSDVALVGLRTSDGSTTFVDQVGGSGEDVVQGLATAADGLLVSGRATHVLESGLAVVDATVAVLPDVQHVTVRVATSGEARSALPVTVDTESGHVASVTVTGPCHVESAEGAAVVVRLDQVGSCSITAEVRGGRGWPPGRATALVAVLPARPWGSYSARASAYPGVLEGNASFRLADGTAPAGSISYSPPLGTALGLGTHTVSALFRSSDSQVADATATAVVVVGPASPQLSWPALQDLVFGTPIPADALDARVLGVNGQPVAGTLRYTTYLTTYENGNPTTRQVAAAGAVLPAGVHRIEVAFLSSDPRYQSIWAARDLRVLRATTSLTTSAALTAGSLRAVLRDASNAVALAGQTVVFSAGGEQCEAVTDDSGVASCPLTSIGELAAVLGGYEVSFSGGPNHEASAAHGEVL